MNRRLLVALAVVLLPACGGEEGASDEAAAPGGGTVVEVALSDFEIQLDSADLDPGTYTFRVTNDGGTTHALEVEGPSGEVETHELAPGESADLAVDLSESGDYELYCPVDGHRGRGMELDLAVGGGGTTTGETTTGDDEDSDYRY
jgi:uncharacterized cupredoxin-like copper-binding protein